MKFYNEGVKNNHKPDKGTTYAPGNASDIVCESTLNPKAKPYTRPLHFKHMSDFLTFGYMTFCTILSLSINLNWITRTNRSLFHILSKIGEEKCSILSDDSFNLESWNESIESNISEIPLIVDIATPNITECDELDTTIDHSTVPHQS